MLRPVDTGGAKRTEERTVDAIAVILVAVVLLVWAAQNGMFRDVDEARYIALKEREPEPWPDREDMSLRHGRPGSGA
jgi:nitrogen fixation-related uncharacterized protein